MKIANKTTSWHLLSSTLSKLWPEEHHQNTVATNGQRSKNRFRSWASANKTQTLGGQVYTPVNVVALESFIKAVVPTISYQGLIASHLQHDASNTKITADAKRNLSIERMVALVEATIVEMKKAVAKRAKKVKAKKTTAKKGKKAAPKKAAAKKGVKKAKATHKKKKAHKAKSAAKRPIRRATRRAKKKAA